MREIEFRGKTKGGRWVYGFYLNYSAFEEGLGDSTEIVRHSIKRYDGGDIEDVIPESVGQYTGLKANGVKIFEGDIVKFKAIRGYDAYGKILWDEKKAAFYSIGKRKAHRHYTTISYMRDTVGIEVIGNIHDNPEILEEGA